MLIQNPDMLWTNNACVVPYSINKSNHDGFDVFASEAFLILGSQDSMHQEQQELNQSERSQLQHQQQQPPVRLVLTES